MSGVDENPSKSQPPPEPPAGPTEELFETADFSVSTDGKLSGNFELSIDAYATQVSQQPADSKHSTGGSSCTERPAEPLPTDIPGFRVESELGRGAFGVVYAARDELLDRKVAIKKPLISDPTHRQQYIDEARKAVKLDHPGIVPIFQVGMTASDEPFVVQKLIEGSNLRRMLQEGGGRLTLAQSISIIRQVCLAVDAAHTAGIVHRDLKPENLLIEPDGRVYVADFGLAILEDDIQQKKGREVAGTPLYMSPEQFAGRVEWLDGRSDIWAIGVILYELLSGKTPFVGSTLNDLKDQIRNKDPRPIHQRDPKIPSGFDAVFRKCCAKNVGDRYSSIRELIIDLNAVVESLSLSESINWEIYPRSGASNVSTSFGSTLDTSQAGLTLRGQSTQRKTQTTLQTSFGATTIRQPNVLWTLLGPVLTTVATLGLVTSAAWYMQVGPFAASVEKSASANPSVPIATATADRTSHAIADASGILTGNVDTPPASDKPGTTDALPQSMSVPPVKPFRVSILGDGTHDSIAKAIADSSAGDSITILQGTYRESIVIDRSVALIGEGTVKIIATDRGCVEIQADSEVTIENMSFDCQTPNRNTIDMAGGRLNIKNCNVYASSLQSYDCIKLRKNATLLADQCTFQSIEHAAIDGEKGSTIVVRDSKFSFPGNAEFSQKRCAIKATESRGLVQNCSVLGPCMAGLDWMDCPKESLIIDGCVFENCSTGIQVRACEDVKIRGLAEQPCEITNSMFGLNLIQSKVQLEAIKVVGAGESSRVGLQLTAGSDVTCTDSNFGSVQCGVLVKKSKLHLDNLSVHSTSFAGMLVDDAAVEGDDLHLLNALSLGLAVLSTNTRVKLGSLEIQGTAINGRKLTPAIYATSGQIEFGDGLFTDCLCGIFVDPERGVIEEIGLPKKSILAELIQSTKTINLPLPVVNGDRMLVTQCDWGWMFVGTGASHIKQLEGDLPVSKREPKLLKSDLQVERAEDQSFVVRRKPK